MQQDLTRGSIRSGLIRFSLPLIAGNLLQQFYNIADTLIVGRFLGNVALAAVGSAFSLMVLLTSLVLGLCMGSGVVFSQLYGEGSRERLKTAIANAFVFIAILSLVLTAASYALLNAFLSLLRVPQEAIPDITAYLSVVFSGIFFTFLYNFFAAVLRSVGNSLAPLLFLLVSTVVNIALDLVFVLVFKWGVSGMGDGDCADSLCAGHWALFPSASAGAAPETGKHAVQQAAPFAHRQRQRPDQRAAVHHELRHPNDSEPCQQFRHRNNGGFRGRRQD